MTEPYVITRLCRDCVDGSCVDVCPVDCIYERRDPDDPKLPNQLFINPEDCIFCGMCEPACPWEAIFEEPYVPTEFESDIELNATTVEQPDRFDVALNRLTEPPTREQVVANKRKWGLRDPAA
ncbi:4Fe-4S binding protein [Desulfobulbus sp. AH-315-M07]|nr:4Fe-4S binding protein [Desulfobulbus sp. AH-315-M07]